MDFTEGTNEVRPLGLLEEITGGAGLEGLKDVVGVLVDGQHHKLGGRELGFELADALGAVHAGQVDVHEDDVGLELADGSEGAFARAMVAHAAEAVGAIDPVDQDLPRLGIVFHDGNFDCH
jgi:hypothetical protein